MEINYNIETREATHLSLVSYSLAAKLHQAVSTLRRFADPLWRCIYNEVTKENKSEEDALNELVGALKVQCDVSFGKEGYTFDCHYRKVTLGYLFTLRLEKDDVVATKAFGILNYPLGDVVSHKQLKSVRWQLTPVYYRGERATDEILFVRQNDNTCLTFFDWEGLSKENEALYQHLIDLVNEKKVRSVQLITKNNMTCSEIVRTFIERLEIKA